MRRLLMVLASLWSVEAAADPLAALWAGRLDEAELVLAMAPGPAALYARGIVRQETGDLDAAASLFLQALEDPGIKTEPRIALGCLRRLETLLGEAPSESKLDLPVRLARLSNLDNEGKRRAAFVAAQSLRRRGDEAGARERERQAGCPRRWVVAGPIGHHPRLDLGAAFPPVQQSYAGKLASAPARGCQVALDGATGHSGVIYGLGWAHTPDDKAGKLLVGVDTESPYRLYIDDREVIDSRAEDRWPSRIREVEVEVGSGWHRIALKIAAPGGRADVSLWAYGAQFYDGNDDGRPVFNLKTPARKAERVAKDALAGYLTASGTTPFDDLVGLEAALAFGDAESAEVRSQHFVAVAPRLGIAYLLRAQVALSDPSRPAQFAQDRARAALEQGLSVEPHLVRARNLRAQMSLNADRPREALARIAEAPPPRAGAAAYWRFSFVRYQAYKARGWLREAEAALVEARRLHPTGCALYAAEIDERQSRHDVASAIQLARHASRCEGGSDELAEALRDAHDPVHALEEYVRLLALEPGRETFLSGYAEALSQAGRHKEAATTFAMLAQHHPRSPRYFRQLSDERVALTDLAGARRAIEDGLAQSPESQELSRAAEALCHEAGADRSACVGVDAFRVNAKAVIDAFRKSGNRYDAPAVIVLDRTVTRVFSTGARITLTHNIIQVLQKSGIDKWGEVQIPDGADVLTLRTIKADGSTREPEEIGGKDSISAPDLEPGDFVEFEYVDPSGAPAAFPNGFLAERFFFRSFDAPLDKSEYLLVTPSGMPVILDSRAGAPAVVLAKGPGVDLRTFSDVHCPQTFAEPASVPYAEYLPSVRAGAGVSVEGWRDHLRDSQFGTLRANAELRQIAATETRGKTTLAAKVDALGRWTRRHIKGSGMIDEPATSVIARGEGNRLVALAALLRAVGIESRLWLSHAAADPILPGPLPDLEAFDEPLLEVVDPTAKTPVLVETRYRHQPTGFLSTVVRGQEALVLSAGAVRMAKVPSVAQAQNLKDDRQLIVEGRLDAGGGGELHVTEKLRGWPAVEWREALDRLEANRVRPEFEQRTLGFYFPGSTLLDLHWQGADDDEGEFVVEYRFSQSQIGRRVGGGLVLPAPYPALLGRRYVGVNVRHTTLVVDYAAPTRLHAVYQLPRGSKVSLPSAVSLSDVGVFQQTSRLDGDQLIVDGNFELSRQRVAPDRYRAFVDYASAVDRAEGRLAEVK